MGSAPSSPIAGKSSYPLATMWTTPLPPDAPPSATVNATVDLQDVSLDDSEAVSRHDCVEQVIDLVPTFVAKKLRHAPQLVFWSQVLFMPGDDSRLVTSVKVYKDQNRTAPIVANASLEGSIYLWHLQPKGRPAVGKKLVYRSGPGWPHFSLSPSGHLLCYVSNGVVLQKTADSQNKTELRLARDMRMGAFRHSALSPCGAYLASVQQFSGQYELCVCTTFSNRLKVQKLCHHLCQGFGPSATYNDHVECQFSPDSSLLAVSSSLGMLFVAATATLQLHSNISPGLTPHLAAATAFNFDPRRPHQALTLCSAADQLVTYDLEAVRVLARVALPARVGSAQVLRYSPSGRVVAVATASTAVCLYGADDLRPLYTLNCCDQGFPYGPAPPSAGRGLALATGASFSQDHRWLAVSYTDAYVRLWRLPALLTLQELCRLSLLRHVRPAQRIRRLPLPTKLVHFILCYPEQRGQDVNLSHLSVLSRRLSAGSPADFLSM